MPKRITGTVIKKSGHQTISVLVKRRVKHAKYLKQMTKSSKFLVHDPNNSAEVGQEVTIIETRPLSKLKHFIVSDSKPVAEQK